jgi:hypothetical protein
MPWKASSVMEEHLRFVARLLDGEACWSAIRARFCCDVLLNVACGWGIGRGSLGANLAALVTKCGRFRESFCGR